MIEKTKVDEPLIGSFVLESLTTGMYGEQSNAIREYVQNSHDAIVAARRANLIAQNEGTVTLTIAEEEDQLIIRDDGIGLPRATAVETLTAMGASRKKRGQDAGFRGIGRLAGIAFSDKLTFRTKRALETNETIVEFDCVALRAGMHNNRHKEAAKLISECVTWWEEVSQHAIEDHFFQVILEGLKAGPSIVRNRTDLMSFLGQVAPVNFHPDFPFTEAVERGLDGPETADILARVPRERVKVKVCDARDETEEEVFKPYRKILIVGSPPRGTELQGVRIRYGGGTRAWWGWIGIKQLPGAYNDAAVAGLRIKVNSIQIDGNNLIRAVPVSTAKKRLEWETRSDWFIGEIYVDPLEVVPNARRDGFEEDDAWLEIRRELTSVCEELRKEAHAISKKHQHSIEKISKRWNDLIVEARKVGRLASPDPARVDQLRGNLAKLQNLIQLAIEDSNDEQASRLKLISLEIVQTRSNLTVKPATSDTALRETIKKEFLETVINVLEQRLPFEYLDDIVTAVKTAVG